MKAPTLPAAIAAEFDRMRELTSRNLDALIDVSGKSRRGVAAALGLTPRYVNDRAIGAVEMSASDLAMFATYFNKPVSLFYDETPIEAPHEAIITKFAPNAPRENVNTRSNGYKLGRSVVELAAHRTRRAERSA